LPPVKEAAHRSQSGIGTPQSQSQTQSVPSQLQSLSEKRPATELVARDVDSVDGSDAGPDVKVPTEEELARSTGDWTVYRFYFKAFGWIAASLFIISMTIFVFATSFPR
jgi:hypothetical protein